MNKPKISVIGLGFVGLTLAVINARKGFDTIGIDIDKEKLEKLTSGQPDFFEPNLEKFLKESLRLKKINFTDKVEEILKTDITFLTVGTPTTLDGKIDLSQLKSVVLKLVKILKKKKTSHLIVVKSTVIPTTTSEYIEPHFKNLKNISVVVNPEFLREGNAIRDLLEPHLIVIGEKNKKEGKFLEKYYKLFYKKIPEIISTSHTTAEMIKYSNNVFLATKISFINSIANICQNLPMVDVNKVAYAIGKDSRIGPQFLNAGPGFGGSCLPKDLSALIGFSKKLGKINNLFKAVEEVNELQHMQIIQMLKDMDVLNPGKTISILGLSFKSNTDDIRAAVSIKLVKNLLRKKVKVKVHDPMAMKNFAKIFGKKIVFCKSIQECLRDSEGCVVLTEWNDYKKLRASTFSKYMREPNIIDARRILNPSDFTNLNFRAIGLGPGFIN